MRGFAVIILLIVAVAAQAMAPDATHAHAANPHDNALAHASSAAPSASASKHPVGTEQTTSHDRCATVGHCTASAIGAEYFVYEAARMRASRTATRVRNEPESGFAFPPYRPPSPTL
jgi:hypothetical protein